MPAKWNEPLLLRECARIIAELSQAFDAQR
jgi:hypothetical protein